MDTAVETPYVRRLSVGLVTHTNQEIFPNMLIPWGITMMVNVALQPKLAMGLERSEGLLTWLVAKAIIINGRRYTLDTPEGVLAKYKYGEIIPVVRTSPDDVYKATGATLWPVVARRTTMFR